MSSELLAPSASAHLSALPVSKLTTYATRTRSHTDAGSLGRSRGCRRSTGACRAMSPIHGLVCYHRRPPPRAAVPPPLLDPYNGSIVLSRGVWVTGGSRCRMEGGRQPVSVTWCISTQVVLLLGRSGDGEVAGGSVEEREVGSSS